MKHAKQHYWHAVVAALLLPRIADRLGSQHSGTPAVRIDGDDIGGVFTGTNGPEAGIWVIAEFRSPPAT